MILLLIVVVVVVVFVIAINTPTQLGGSVSPSVAIIAQINGRGEQDKYLIGEKGLPIIDSTKPNGQWVKCGAYGPNGHYASPSVIREVNYPNKVFSWGDIINRYYDKGFDVTI